MFSGKDNCVFLRNVTQCYAKKIVVQTFSVLLSHYYRITIALASYINARVIQAICLVGVNVNFAVICVYMYPYVLCSYIYILKVMSK